MKRLFYIRHGETEDNRRNVYSGQSNAPLTPLGVSEAKAAVPALVGQPIQGQARIQMARQSDPSVESLDSVRVRLTHLLCSLAGQDGNILLVGHNGTGLILTSILTGATIEDLPVIPYAKVFELPLENLGAIL